MPREIVDLLMHTDAYRVVSRTPGDTRWRATSTTYGDWLDAYTVAVHTARRLGPEGAVRVVADTDISQQEPQR